jgi:putative ABC transport system permease protein
MNWRQRVPVPPPTTPHLLSGLGRDIRYGARALAHQRGFSLLAMLTIALAIGVTTTLFSVLDAVLFRPLPWFDADRLVRLTETHAGATRQIPQLMTNVGYLPWTVSPSTIDGLGAWSTGAVTLTMANDATRIQATRVTPSLFPMLRAAPLLGSLFSNDVAQEVIISHGLWLERFGGSADAVSRAIEVNGETDTIVGVMPPAFEFPDRETRLWRPLQIPPASVMAAFSAMARLRPGVTPEQAAAEATARANSVSVRPTALMMMFGTTGPAQILAQPALEALTHEVRPGLVALFVAVSLLLVGAIANIASLQLARATTRYREMAIRSALGAGTARLVQQLIVEHLLLTGAGGAVGVALTVAAHRALPSVLPPNFPRLEDIGVRWTVVLFALSLATLTGVVLGTLPALHLRRLRLTQALTEAAAVSIGGTRARARVWIMTGQIAIACTLLVGALLLGRSFVAMLVQDRGFDSAHLLTARLNLPATSNPQARIDAVEDFVARAHTLPGTPVVAVTTGLPLSGSENLSGFDMPSVRPPIGVNINVHAVRSVVTADYLGALGLRLIAGRDFRPDDDSASAPKVVTVNHTFATQYLTSRAIGDRIRNFMTGDGVDFEVIGVVADMRRRGLTDRVQPEIYSLLRQSPRPSAAQDLVIRTFVEPSRLAEPLRDLAHRVVTSATVESVRTMDDRILGSLAGPRLYAVLLAAFAVSALIITGVGLVGVLSYSVAQRAREIALRVALGAAPAQVLRLVLSQGLAVTATGIAAGLVVAALAARYVSTLLYGISMHDALSFLAAPLTLILVALGACLVPAVRAMRINPLSALRG